MQQMKRPIDTAPATEPRTLTPDEERELSRALEPAATPTKRPAFWIAPWGQSEFSKSERDS